MAERESGGTPWIAFLAGAILVAIVAVGVVAYNGGLAQQQERAAELQVDMPDIRVNPPDIDLPEPPPPQPDAESAETPANP